VGGIRWVRARNEAGRAQVFTVLEVARAIHSGHDTFFVSSADSPLGELLSSPISAEVTTAISARHHEYIKTITDHVGADNLLALPRCQGCDQFEFREGHDDEDSGNAEPDSNPPDQGPPDD
jgi:hypothetical protein